MNTLILPCAGRSSRFPNVRPKWMLYYPDKTMMVEKAVSGLNLNNFDRVIITIVKDHAVKYKSLKISLNLAKTINSNFVSLTITHPVRRKQFIKPLKSAVFRVVLP